MCFIWCVGSCKAIEEEMAYKRNKAFYIYNNVFMFIPIDKYQVNKEKSLF